MAKMDMCRLKYNHSISKTNYLSCSFRSHCSWMTTVSVLHYMILQIVLHISWVVHTNPSKRWDSSRLLFVSGAWHHSSASPAGLQRFKRCPVALWIKYRSSALCRCPVPMQATVKVGSIVLLFIPMEAELFTTLLHKRSGNSAETGPQLCLSIIVVLKQLQQRIPHQRKTGRASLYLRKLQQLPPE